MQKYSVGIIGLGKIGMLFDYDVQDSDIYLSHLKAFYHHPRFEVKWAIDPCVAKLEKARERYTGDIHFIEGFNHVNIFPDLVVIATPTAITRDVFQKLKDKQEIKLFVLEKPLWNENWDFAEYESISSRCVVNYIRKYMPFVRELKEKLNSGEIGKPLSMQINYTKGLMNNGSHFIDLANYIFGPSFMPESVQIINRVNDYIEDDPSISFSVNYRWRDSEFPVVFQCGDERVYSQIEWNIYFEKSRIRVFDFEERFEQFELREDPLFKGYFNMQKSNLNRTEINRYAWFMCEYLVDVIESKVENTSGLKAEYSTNKLIEVIKKKL